MADRAAYYGDKGSIDGDLAVGGDIAVTGDATVGGAATVTGNATVGGAATVTGNVSTSGDVVVAAVGKGLKVKTGANATMGRGTLNGATEVTIATTKVTANSNIFLISPHGTPAWALGVSSRSAGVSFGVKGVAADTSDFAWMIVEPSP
jgi:hypothetical protein